MFNAMGITASKLNVVAVTALVPEDWPTGSIYSLSSEFLRRYWYPAPLTLKISIPELAWILRRLTIDEKPTTLGTLIPPATLPLRAK
jgi:hypothetical protein